MSSGQVLPTRPLLYRLLKKYRFKLNDLAARFSLIPNDPVLDPSQFDWARELAVHWEAIRDEALAIYEHRDAIPPLRKISADHRRIATDDGWRSFFLIGYGNAVEENIARAPRTTELVRRIPQLNSAFFSILAPGAHIIRHRGVSKSFFTAHLGLCVPDDHQNCVMQVEDQYVHWREGEWTVFDDTYEHEVWNRTDEPRIILLCQVGRPLKAPGTWLARGFEWYLRRSPFVTEARQELGQWEEAYKESEQQAR
ncbi:aspartyl/asparaginyl beta-hydroxylase domain-containing protein [Aurantiacibacter sp. D1-12]|uniref:aspartyl/asparaginyl beta-hydroxylase domain-containing protein n=1 Tax=Aurantiacibacter sp. D1-12 TaxID=2993658 RepID=UPI00237CD406|nr:aspartyl/asparaginyl beta-hydroxylase domain-containing protein [Aurantiacibacter sp. D1-12]MDE1466698.1 aspartyl/asparaginyl beta-hydroxylase domain-containing protein [Aurantiacibacter sp. D1-12]